MDEKRSGSFRNRSPILPNSPGNAFRPWDDHDACGEDLKADQLFFQ
jgi:hypothetical protein